MTSLLAATERAKYKRVWADQRYRHNAWGLALWREQRAIFPAEVSSALDVGCGHGRLMAHWLEQGIDARGIDIVDALDEEIRAAHRGRLTVCPLWDYAPGVVFDLAVAADVLEHLPEGKVPAALAALAVCAKVVVAQTAEYPSVDWEGVTLHLTLRHADWWAVQMAALGGAVEQLPMLQRRKAGPCHLLRWRTPAGTA